MAEDTLSRACAKVGCFLFHFAKLENQIDAGLARLFELDAIAAKIIRGSVDFFKRLNMLETWTLIEIADLKERERVAKIFSGVKKQNDNRQVIAHSAFAPTNDEGVEFSRVVARDGKITEPLETWSDKKFVEENEKIQKLVLELAAAVENIKPAKHYILQLDTGRYQYGFSSLPSLALLASENEKPVG
jgi:hypothetical protein